MSFVALMTAVLLATLGVPLLFAIALGCIFAIATCGDTSLLAVIQQLFQSANLYPIVAVPLFMLAGEVMNRGGLSRRIVDLSNHLVGRVAGSSGLTTTAASMLFAAISGSSAATAAAVGTIMIPSMIHDQFRRTTATAIQAFSACLGIVIPPSITLIIYGALTGVSIGQLFMASLVPGVVAGLAIMAVTYLHARKNNLPVKPFTGWTAARDSLRDAFWAAVMPLVILGGIFGGVFTPTEAAAVAVAYGLFVSVFIHRELRWSDFYSVFSQSALRSSVPVLLFSVAGLLNYILNFERVPESLAETALGMTSNRILFLLAVNVFLFVLGMLMESSALLVVLTPVLAPLAQDYGVNLVHFGVVMNLNLAIGQASPPVGSTLFVSCAVSKTNLSEMFGASVPYLTVSWLLLLLVSFFPGVCLC